MQTEQVLTGIDGYIVPPALFPVSGLYGSYLLGRQALEQNA